MSGRRIRLELVEVTDRPDLETLAALVSDDAEGSAEFGGFYGDALQRLGPLLGDDRRVWLLYVDGAPVGLLDAERDDESVSLAYFVVAAQRGRGIARGAVGRLLGLAPWPDAVTYTAAIAPDNTASAAVARARGFRPGDTNDDGEIVWERPVPPRRETGPERFLTREGQIDRYPMRGSERRALLEWVADRALPFGEVWTEPEVNDLLAPYAPAGDVAVLRRYLVDADLLERTRSGSEYARVTLG